jgi:hypothetical protein
MEVATIVWYFYFCDERGEKWADRGKACFGVLFCIWLLSVKVRNWYNLRVYQIIILIIFCYGLYYLPLLLFWLILVVLCY